MNLNIKTAWNDTYREVPITNDKTSGLSVFSALHETVGPILRVEINVLDGAIRLACKASLTPEQAEEMASELLAAANLTRNYAAAWDHHKSAQELQEAA